MNTRRLASLLTLLLFVTPAWADLDPISTISLVPDEEATMIFVNTIPPCPDYKELQFTGTVNMPIGAVATLLIEFDYMDPNNGWIVVPAPNSIVNLVGGAPIPIDSGIYTIPFCPDVVSLHFKNLGPDSFDIQGIYRHECFAVPEPSTWTLALLAIAGLVRVVRQDSRLTSCVFPPTSA
jgi:hypothetical protein